MDRASPRLRAAETRRSPRRDTSSPGDRTARTARRPTTSKFLDVQLRSRFSESIRDARPCRFPARTPRLSLTSTGTVRARHRRGFHELEHEAIGLAAMLEHEPASIVLGMPQRARCAVKFEPRLLNILD